MSDDTLSAIVGVAFPLVAGALFLIEGLRNRRRRALRNRLPGRPAWRRVLGHVETWFSIVFGLALLLSAVLNGFALVSE